MVARAVGRPRPPRGGGYNGPRARLVPADIRRERPAQWVHRRRLEDRLAGQSHGEVLDEAGSGSDGGSGSQGPAGVPQGQRPSNGDMGADRARLVSISSHVTVGGTL